MKKTMIIILAVLPIFLVVMISFAAKIVSFYQHIAVESVIFVNEENEEYSKDFVFKINIGEQKQTNIQIIPEYATNQNVSYSSTDESVCTIDEKGVIEGVKFGTSIIMVKTEDGGKYAMLIIKVSQDNVESVSFSEDEVEVNIGETKQLEAIVNPYVALNKNVTYESSDENVAVVDINGKVTAVGEGEAIITVTTEDGGFTDTCKIVVKYGKPALCFDLSDDNNFVEMTNGYIANINEINLLNYLQIDEKRVILSDVRLRIKSGSDIAQLTDGNLVITGKGIIRIVAYVGDQNNPTYQTELRLLRN